MNKLIKTYESDNELTILINLKNFYRNFGNKLKSITKDTFINLDSYMLLVYPYKNYIDTYNKYGGSCSFKIFVLLGFKEKNIKLTNKKESLIIKQLNQLSYKANIIFNQNKNYLCLYTLWQYESKFNKYLEEQ
tara:strand:- start:1344 stop:1742 length:399 start_codon:yes stop_codon:yes gene_type:complete